MQNIKVLVVGDAMEDIYHIGTSTRMSAEAPVPIVLISDTISFPGGASNVTRNLRELGVDTNGCYGLEAKKHRLMNGDTQIARWDENDISTPIKYWDDGLTYDAIVISDYGKGSITPTLIKGLSNYDCPFFIDTKQNPTAFAGLPGESFFFPNSVEFLQYQKEYLQLDNVIYKHGATGMTLLQNGNVVSTLPALCKYPVSVCGAGDSVLSAFTKRYLETKDPVLALAYANAAAAVVVGKPFTSVATELEIAEYLYIYEY